MNDSTAAQADEQAEWVSPTELFRRAWVARELGKNEEAAIILRELALVGVKVAFCHPKKKPALKCLHCEQPARTRGVCKTHHRAVMDLLRRGEVTNEQLVAAGAILPSKKPWTHAQTGAREAMREKIRQWQVKEN